MRILKFNITNQILKRDESCDFSGIVSGSKNHFEAEFIFNDEWNNYKKVAVFVNGDKEYPTAIIDGKCKINNDALTSRSFLVYVVGKKNEEQIKTTSKRVRQVLK